MRIHQFRAGLVGIAAAATLMLPNRLTAQASVSTDPRATTVDTTAQGYVELLTKANNDEINAGRNALNTTQNPQVRAYAQKLVDDHTKALDKLGPIASRMGVSNMAAAIPEGKDRPMSHDSTMPRPEEGMGAMGDSTRKAMSDTTSRPTMQVGDSMGASSGQPQLTDKQFIDAMVVNHQQLLGKLPEDGRGIKDKELRSYVSDMRKSVQRHFTMARDIQTKMGGREK